MNLQNNGGLVMLKSLNNENSNYLDFSSLVLNYPITKKAFVLSVKMKFDSNGDPFCVYTMKDINGIKIIGRKFRATERDAYIKALEMKGKIVEMDCTPQSWNNSVSVIIDNIRISDGDYSLFLQTIPNLDALCKSLENSVSKFSQQSYSVPAEFKLSTLSNVCNGLTGGYIQLLTGAFNKIISYKAAPGFDIELALNIYQKIQYPFFHYLQLESTMDAIPFEEMVRLLEMVNTSCCNIHSTMSDSEVFRLNNATTDCMGLLMGMQATNQGPRHVYAYLVYKALRDYLFELSVAYDIPRMIKGSTLKEGDVLLTNY